MPTPASARLLALLERGYRRADLTGRSVLLAVSGGADSSALLLASAHLAPRLRLRAEVATLDHGLRPAAADDVRQVQALAHACGLVCHLRKLSLPLGPGVEARAREARYEALEALRRERGLDAVVTAHTASDQAETLLMRLARGSALRGARAIHAQRGTLVRPLLEATRAEVEAFLGVQGVVPRRDPMNADPAFLRSRIRHAALPALQWAAGFPVAAHLAAFAQAAAEDEALLDALARDAWERVRLADGSLDALALRALEPALRRRVVRRLLAGAGAEPAHLLVEGALEALARGGRLSLGRTRQLRCAGGRVRCVALPAGEAAPAAGELHLAGPGEAGLQPGTGWRFGWEVEPAPGRLHLAVGGGTRWPLTVRARRRGDRLPGRGRGRSLQDFLVDRRVPAERRGLVPVVVDARGQLLWLPGLWAAPPAGPVVGYLRAAPPGGDAHAPPL